MPDGAVSRPAISPFGQAGADRTKRSSTRCSGAPDANTFDIQATLAGSRHRLGYA